MEAGEPDARAPVFSPDGRWIAFLSTRARPEGWKQTPPAPPESDPATDIWLIPAARRPGHPARRAEKPYGRVFNDGFYGRLAFSPDGRSSPSLPTTAIDPRTPEEIRNDVLIVRPDQGEGYTGYGTAQIWVAHLDAKPEQHSPRRRSSGLTKDDVWYGDPQWSPDGKTLVVHANRTAERESVRYSINRNFDLLAIDVASGKLRQLTHGAGPEVSPRFSPDGKSIACLSVPRSGSHRDVFNLAVVSLEWREADVPRAVRPPRGSKGREPAAPRTGRSRCRSTAGTATRISSTTPRSASATQARPGRCRRTGKANAWPDKDAARTGLGRCAAPQAQLTPPGNLFLRERQAGAVGRSSPGRTRTGRSSKAS